MIKYVPFLKCKSNEIISLSLLDEDVLEKIIPFFDFPRKNKGNYTPENFAHSVERISKCMKKYIGKIHEMYVDTFDIEESLIIAGSSPYELLIANLLPMNVVPVVGVDRSKAHIDAVFKLKSSGDIISNTVALRLTHEDFQSYDAVEGEINDVLSNLFSLFDNVDIIFDCRVCKNLDLTSLGGKISKFHAKFSKQFPVRYSIVAGSSIPPSISDVLSVDKECFLPREELKIYHAANTNNSNLIYGDYTIVSPNYSEVDIMPQAMLRITTAKIVYTIEGHHFFLRGRSLKTGGFEQYFDLAKDLCSRTFYRGAGYSDGDKYFQEKSKRLGGNAGPGTVIKPSVNAHITYIVRNGPN